MSDWPTGKYGAILADCPWRFNLWWGGQKAGTPAREPSRATVPHYETMTEEQLSAMPVSDLAADDCVLFLWATWPCLQTAERVLAAWGFEYKTCGFVWVKGDELPLFPDDRRPHMGLGYWARLSSEPCLLATRGKPKRQDASVHQVIWEPRREHSRKPDCVYERIERLVAGPYLELFARNTRPGWSSWGDQVGKFAEVS